ncbi:YafY family protein [Streptomyces sp. Qhu-G9]|uniref:helix-turn-helix transcriptional regulator n=1 Tax=Streptomyces sp. Qhu-G9 TaxID=3452799 RepID=UPI0022AC5487|nr:YafY family protein [Streptomyces aurantiacus]WAU83167.1 YafY family protein [Streptomyces aurantiacus]
MLDTSARLLRLLSLLQAPRAWPGSELAERLGVSGRTVRNDIDRLRELGYPVDATRGAVGGYRLGAGAAMPPLLLDDDEAVVVTIALRTATEGAVPGTEETALRALTKLEQVLPSRLRRRVRALHAFTVTVPADRPAPSVSADVLTTLVSACRDREQLRFDYLDHAGTPTLRVVEPYRAVNWGQRWYLVAWDLAREDWRTFRIDRIQPRTPTGPRFTPREPPGGDITAYVSLRVSSASWRHHARVTVHAPATAVIEQINPAVGTVQALDTDTCVLTTGADSVQRLAVYLGMLDFDFDVTEPAELVDHLRRLADRYSRSTPPVRQSEKTTTGPPGLA